MKEEVLTTEDIARDILRTSYKLLKRYDDSIEKDDKEKYLQYAPQVFEMCADFQNQFQLVSVGKEVGEWAKKINSHLPILKQISK